MKITLKDFGPISHFEFDLEKDLHVIFGKNNVGKSYAITAVYLILKNLILQSDEFYQIELFLYTNLGNRSENLKKSKKKSSNTSEKFQNTLPYGLSDVINDIKYINNEIIYEINHEKKSKVSVTKGVATVLTKLFNYNFLKKLENSFKNSFPPIEDLSNKFSKNDFRISITSDYFILDIKNKRKHLFIESIELKSEINILAEAAEGEYNIVHPLTKLYSAFNSDISSFYNKIYFLPASRSGLYQALNNLSAMYAELSQNRTFLTSKIELPNLSEPISDYFLNLSTIGNSTHNIGLSPIVKFIEDKILQGKILFNQETKKIMFSQSELDEELDLSVTSAMVAEIAPIVAYLKYIVNKDNDSKKSVLFIEEAEAHLHPEIQVRLIEVFTKLISKNVKIVMTCHSNYMFNKLSNLILDKKIDYRLVDSCLMRATPQGSITDTLSMKAEADGMNDENFADVAEMLYEERIKIYDKLNKATKNAD